jgi:hypothetical protein
LQQNHSTGGQNIMTKGQEKGKKGRDNKPKLNKKEKKERKDRKKTDN